jgi:hypothetical protein
MLCDDVGKLERDYKQAIRDRQVLVKLIDELIKRGVCLVDLNNNGEPEDVMVILASNQSYLAFNALAGIITKTHFNEIGQIRFRGTPQEIIEVDPTEEGF